ncbi:MAG: African swine fever virus J13L protein [Rhodobacteraceae bacterium HLUCCA09]|nr:MAG: African swine fever virus J13L protein [Rhodobacteraceae bacterium HLUCCA09]
MTARRKIATGLSGLTLAGGLGGCADMPLFEPRGESAAQPAAVAPLPGAGSSPGAAAGAPVVDAVTVEEFDTTTPEERAAAAAPPPRASGGDEALGTTVASLGNPAEPGFWAETPLVASARQGRLTNPDTGASVQVELRPSGGEPGSGSRVSLPAFRVLGAPLTALPELTVTGL